DYPEASYEEREKIVQAHRNYQQGLMWTLAYHPRIPQKVRDAVSKWGTCKDEYEKGSNGWQEQLYIREARRMKS
ncbi:FAD-dependent oxidoreductase, partial [Proteiniphilum sp. UBA5480]|uniref:FAD-dependent oxidoreductase n=1 Tax=Proteiniphilum sp. UBA5480 TaxID=1947282 RepID=UPI002580CF8B